MTSRQRRKFGRMLNPAPDQARSIFRTGVVTALRPGAATDGLTQVTVTVDGDTFDSRYLGAAPAVGDLVRVEFTAAGDPTIFGAIHGEPTY